MTDKFHRAAKDGYLTTLKEATKRDCNLPDEDGLTPTACASHEGNLDALRVLVGRGGDPDKCDYYGNTALHCAAAKGHMHCVSFLVNFGVNIWSLDNEFHSALDLAAINNRDEIVRYLDMKAARQEQEDEKKYKKMQEKAQKDAEKRQKEFDKIQKRADKKREDEELKFQKEKEDLLKKETTDENKPPKKKSVFDTISKSSFNILIGGNKTENKAIHKNNTSQPVKFSELTQNSANNKKTAVSGIQKKILQKKKMADENKSTNNFKIREVEVDGKKSMKNLSGLQLNSEIIIVPNKSLADSSRRGKLEDVFEKNHYAFQKSNGSLFDRPGIGSIAFRNSVVSAMSNRNHSSLSEESNSSKQSSEDAKDSSLESYGSNRTPFEEEDLPSDDEGEDSPLYLFLSSYGLQDFMPNFTLEQIDMESLLELTDQDLENTLRLPLGPRRKLLKALNERKLAVERHMEVMDVKL